MLQQTVPAALVVLVVQRIPILQGLLQLVVLVVLAVHRRMLRVVLVVLVVLQHQLDLVLLLR